MKRNLSIEDCQTTSAPEPTPDAPATALALPEAPASVNCHITIEGRQVEATLRDTDEARLLTRLAALLRQYPSVQPPTQPPTQASAPPTHDDSPYCQAHKAVLKRYERNGQVWYSHKLANGQWCRGK
jgi:hypothetical protein